MPGRHEQSKRGRAAEHRPSACHLITSARNSSDRGIVKPSANIILRTISPPQQQRTFATSQRYPVGREGSTRNSEFSQFKFTPQAATIRPLKSVAPALKQMQPNVAVADIVLIPALPVLAFVTASRVMAAAVRASVGGVRYVSFLHDASVLTKDDAGRTGRPCGRWDASGKRLPARVTGSSRAHSSSAASMSFPHHALSRCRRALWHACGRPRHGARGARLVQHRRQRRRGLRCAALLDERNARRLERTGSYDSMWILDLTLAGLASVVACVRDGMPRGS